MRRYGVTMRRYGVTCLFSPVSGRTSRRRIVAFPVFEVIQDDVPAIDSDKATALEIVGPAFRVRLRKSNQSLLTMRFFQTSSKDDSRTCRLDHAVPSRRDRPSGFL